jgi:hypothetical protein
MHLTPPNNTGMDLASRTLQKTEWELTALHYVWHLHDAGVLPEINGREYIQVGMVNGWHPDSVKYLKSMNVISHNSQEVQTPVHELDFKKIHVLLQTYQHDPTAEKYIMLSNLWQMQHSPETLNFNKANYIAAAQLDPTNHEFIGGQNVTRDLRQWLIQHGAIGQLKNIPIPMFEINSQNCLRQLETKMAQRGAYQKMGQLGQAMFTPSGFDNIGGSNTSQNRLV